jgi:hypothetical protein
MYLHRLRLKYRHGITLFSDDVLNSCGNVLLLPQPSRAAMTCPALSIRFIQSHLIQTATRIGFEGVHQPAPAEPPPRPPYARGCFARGPPTGSSLDVRTPPELHLGRWPDESDPSDKESQTSGPVRLRHARRRRPRAAFQGCYDRGRQSLPRSHAGGVRSKRT